MGRGNESFPSARPRGPALHALAFRSKPAESQQPMPNWYGADDEWPRHPESWWRDALPEAKAAEWWLEFNTGNSKHRWGKLRCRRTEGRDASVCTIKVDTSGDGAENVARDVPKKIARCPHRAPDPNRPEARLARANERLNDAERLLDALDRVLHEQGKLVDIQVALFEAFDQAETDVERLLDEAALDEAEAEELVRSAEAEVIAEINGEGGLVVGVVVVEGHLDAATADLAELPRRDSPAQAARRRLAELRERAAAIKGRLEH